MLSRLLTERQIPFLETCVIRLSIHATQIALKESMPKYTASEIEKEDAEYYNLRLTRQENEFKLSNMTGVPVGELRAQEQAGMLNVNSVIGKRISDNKPIERLLIY